MWNNAHRVQNVASVNSCTLARETPANKRWATRFFLLPYSRRTQILLRPLPQRRSLRYIRVKIVQVMTAARCPTKGANSEGLVDRHNKKRNKRVNQNAHVRQLRLSEDRVNARGDDTTVWTLLPSSLAHSPGEHFTSVQREHCIYIKKRKHNNTDNGSFRVFPALEWCRRALGWEHGDDTRYIVLTLTRVSRETRMRDKLLLTRR